MHSLIINHPCNVSSPGPITSLRSIEKGAILGDLDLEINTERFLFFDNRVSGGSLKVRGHIDQCKFIVNYAQQCDFSGLTTRELVFENHSVSDIYIHAGEKITGRINNKGSIYYSGSPDEVTIEISRGTGQVLPWIDK